MPLRVLVADADGDLRGAIAEILADAGHDCAQVRDLDAARVSAAERRFDLAVVDVLLLDAHSERALYELQRTVPALVATTAYLTERHRRWFHRMGIGLIEKPFDIDDLVLAVERASAARASV